MSQTDVVVFGIKKMILDGSLAPGDRLPREKDLSVDLAVSRSSLREGVRALSLMGVLETRQGAGTYVTSLDPSLLMAPLSFIVDLQKAENAINLHVVRRTLEMQAAQLAAVSIDEEGLAAAKASLDGMAAAMKADPVDHATILQCDIAFHRAVAHGSANPVLFELIAALTSQTVRSRLWRAISVGGAEGVTLSEHRSIYNALVEHSPDRAGIRMANHLLQVEDFLASGPPAPSEGPTAEELERIAKSAG
ncbi:MAG: GntR domain protein [Frondihabitans sp.]|nr:GntR domain protein [Frondihabitans sp.]